MLIIGLVGGVASGKSAVARMFEALGAGLLDADRAGHEVLRMPEVETAARARWGEAIFGPDGKIDRRKLAAIVFEPTPEGRAELSFLEQLTHTRIGELIQRQAEAFRAEGRPAAILDAPVMMEAGWNQFCDKVIFIYAPREQRLSRAMARGWSEEEFALREAAQIPLEQKREVADVTIDNSGSFERTEAQVREIWQRFVG